MMKRCVGIGTRLCIRAQTMYRYLLDVRGWLEYFHNDFLLVSLKQRIPAHRVIQNKA